MSQSGDLQFNIANIRHPENYAFNTVARDKHARTPEPPERPEEPQPPANTKQTIAAGLRQADNAAQAFNSAAQDVASIANKIADPLSAGFAMAGAAADEKMSELVSGLAAKLGEFPAATLTGMALGIPHAHVKHPPNGPPPVPPIPLPPLGPILLGTNLTVLINGKPTARCGDYGLNPTCCGVVPPLSALYQIVTGSSNVYIGGARAARANIDITMHCFNVPSPKVSVKLGKLAGLASKAGKAFAVAGKFAAVAGQVAGVTGMITQATSIASQLAEAEADDNAAMADAIGMSVAVMAAQAAADAAGAAMTKTIGTDQPAIIPIGTPGLILEGSPDVLIGGFPLPSFSAIAQGLLKRVKGVKFTGDGAGVGCPSCG